MIGKIYRFIMKRKLILLPPSQLITPYNLRDATRDETLIMDSGFARSPGEARRLMDKYGVYSAVELIDLLPIRKHRSIKRRIRTLFQRLEGHYRGRALRMDKRGHNEIWVRYKYKERK